MFVVTKSLFVFAWPNQQSRVEITAPAGYLVDTPWKRRETEFFIDNVAELTNAVVGYCQVNELRAN